DYKVTGVQTCALPILYILAVPLVILVLTAISLVSSFATGSLSNAGPHGLTEMTYAFTSMANNNGSAFAGLSGDTQWFNVGGAFRSEERRVGKEWRVRG